MNTLLITATAAALLMAGGAYAKGGHGYGDRHGHGLAMPEFSELDTDGNGEITMDEITAFQAAKFSEADSNGDGQLDADELRAMTEARDAERRAERIARMIERKDINGDGVLSAEEMGPDTDRANRIFDHIDRDDSGTISKEEADAARSKMDERRGGRKNDRDMRQDRPADESDALPEAGADADPDTQ